MGFLHLFYISQSVFAFYIKIVYNINLGILLIFRFLIIKTIKQIGVAIRPKIKKYLSLEEYKIYSIIYNRAVASLMTDAVVEDTKVDIMNNGYLFQTSGEKVIFDGFLRIYEEANIDSDEKIDKLPELNVNDVLNEECSN